ncbi:MAG: TIM barrel protein [Chitinophagaceae bacterium]|nr:TIM barrel protein [Chitinophagaceae bacterium]
MERRTFLKNGILTAAVGITTAGNAQAERKQSTPFRMKFSPEFGIFAAVAGKDPADQVKWGYDQGFRAWENTGLKSKSIAEQERISQAVQKLGMEFGQFVGTMTFEKVTFAGKDASLREMVLKDVRESVEIAKRMNTKIVHNVLGMSDPKLSRDFQMVNAVELLKRIADIYEPHNIIMVMESMNHKVDHPGMFLQTIPQAYALAKSVASPSVKVLFDFYHVQVEDGNLLDTLDYAYDEIAYYQLADVPGRKEPTTGEINYKNVLQHLHDKGYRGFVGMEHGTKKPGAEGALAALAAYRSIDPR